MIDEDGSQLGIMPPGQALMLAEEKGLDLVEIAAAATPPVCRIMNSGKFFYQQAKRDAEARKHQRHIKIKEVKFRPKVDEHDFAFKRRNVERFLLDGNKVKSLVIFRGREIVHSEIGREILNRLAVELGDTVLVESSPRQEGNTMVQILAPKKEVAPVKPKPKAKARPRRRRPRRRRRARRRRRPSRDHEKAQGEAEAQDEAGRGQAVQGDRDREDQASQGVQAPHPHQEGTRPQALPSQGRDGVAMPTSSR